MCTQRVRTQYEGRDGGGISFLPSCEFSHCVSKTDRDLVFWSSQFSWNYVTENRTGWYFQCWGEKVLERFEFQMRSYTQMDKVRRPREGGCSLSLWRLCGSQGFPHPLSPFLVTATLCKRGRYYHPCFITKAFEAILTESWQGAECRLGCGLLSCLLLTHQVIQALYVLKPREIK